MNYCTRCGRQTEPGNLFCNGCGDRLLPSVAESADRPQQQEPERPSHATQSAAARAVAPHIRAPEERSPQTRRSAPNKRGSLRWITVTGIVLAAVGCGVAVALIILGSSPAKHTNLSSNTAGASSSQQQSTTSTQQQPTTQPPTTGPPAEQAAAQGLSQLLEQSTSDRSAIVAAFNDVSSCGSGLIGDAQTFHQAASSRKSLLSQLNALPDKDALPPQLLLELNGAWQASYQADQDFAGWANDENSNGCTANDTSDSSYQAATGPDNQATADKRAFVNLWNPIASQYGLPTYQQDQL